MVKKNNYKKDVYQNMTLIMQLAIHMMTPIFLCLAIGLMIDKYFHWHSVLIFFAVGNSSRREKYVSACYGNCKEGREGEQKRWQLAEIQLCGALLALRFCSGL